MTNVVEIGGLKRLALLVEDDPALQHQILKRLSTMGFEVQLAVDCKSAIEKIRVRPPQLVCVNLSLPRESGYEVCEFIRSNPQFEFVQIIIMSNRHTPEDMAHAEEAGANAYIRKPFSLDLLEKYVTTLFAGPTPSRPSIRRLRRSDAP